MGKFFKLDVIKGAMLLTIFGFLGKALSAVFRIGLAYIVGSYGMGLYQLIFPLLVFFVVFSSEGFSLALTIKIAEDKSGESRRAYFRLAAIWTIFFAVFAALILYFASGFLSRIQGGELGKSNYIIIALGVVCVSILSVIKAYIRGLEDFKLFSISEVIEDILKVGFSLVLSLVLMPYGVNVAVLGIFLGIILSSICSIIFLLISVKQKKFKHRNPQRKLLKSEKLRYIQFSIISLVSAIIIPAIGFVESASIMGLLSKTGASIMDATRLYGLSRGSVSALINLPFFVLASVEVVLLPNLARSKNGGIYYKKTRAGLIFAVCVSFPFVLAYMLFPSQIVGLVYGGALSASELNIAANLLKLGAIGIVFSAIASILSVLLNSFNMASATLCAGAIAGAVKLICLFLLVPRLSIYGAEISSVAFSISFCFVVLIFAVKNKLFWAPKKIVPIMLLWGILFAVIYFIYKLLSLWVSSNMAFIIAGVLVGITIILILLVALKFNKKGVIKIAKSVVGFDTEN